MSYEENQGSRRNFNDDSNYDAPGGAQCTDHGGDPSLSGSHGRSGRGRAGRHTGNQGCVGRQDQQNFGPGDNYCDTDPGMAGNRGLQDTQNINVPEAASDQMGGECENGYGHTVGGEGRSRGYERDSDEYDDSRVGRQGQGAGAETGAGRGPTGKTPSMGSKLMGGIEKMAAKIT